MDIGAIVALLPHRYPFLLIDAIFKDHDQDVLEFEDYHTYQGCRRRFRLRGTRMGYGMVSQRFVTKVIYNPGIAADKFDPDKLPAKK